MTYIKKNHKTATVLVAVAAVLVAAGTISTAAVSDHTAFAHKKGAKKSFENSGILVPTITAQKQKCENAGVILHILQMYIISFIILPF